MAKKPKLSTALVPASTRTGNDTESVIAALDANPNVKAYWIHVDKEKRVAKVRTVSRDGQTITRDFIGPGLTSTMTSAPVGNTASDRREARDQNICALYREGLTQEEIAECLNWSQSLVSNVVRQNGLR
jgi:DNA-binding NarL/FixJ family response regulator